MKGTEKRRGFQVSTPMDSHHWSQRSFNVRPDDPQYSTTPKRSQHSIEIEFPLFVPMSSQHSSPSSGPLCRVVNNILVLGLW